MRITYQKSTLLFIFCLCSMHQTTGTLHWLKNLFNSGSSPGGGYGYGGGGHHGGGFGAGFTGGGGGGFGSSLFGRHPWLMKAGKSLFGLGGGRRPQASGSGWFGGGGHGSGGYIGGYGNSIGGYFPQHRPPFGGHSSSFFGNKFDSGHYDRIIFPREDTEVNPKYTYKN